MAADGSIVISVDLDQKEAQKELNQLTREIRSLEEKLGKAENKKSPLELQAEGIRAKMKEATAQAEQYKQAWISGAGGADREEMIARERVAQLGQEYDAVVAKIDKVDAEIMETVRSLDYAKSRAGELAQQVGNSERNSRKLEKATKRASKSMGLFATRLRGILLSAFVFNILSSGLRNFTKWLGNAIKSNDQAASAIARLKGALLTLAQPIVSVLVPAFTTLINILTRVVSTIAQLFAMLTGASIESTKEAAEALYQETEALEGTGAAAEEAAGSLAAFDEINTIQTENKSSGGGGAAAETIAPDFDFESDLSEDRLRNILALIEAIGSAFLAWRIGSALGMSLKQIAGLALAIYSAIQFVKNIMDAWTNGVNFGNLLGSLLSLLALAGGLYLAFGNVGAAIGLIVGGLAMLATGFHDAAQNGWNLENMLMTIAGIMATGAGISILVGSWIPLIIAAIASLLLVITDAFGEGENLIKGIQQIIQGFIDFFVGVFTGDIDRAIQGAIGIVEGLKTAVNAIFDALKNMVTSLFSWIDDKIGGQVMSLDVTLELIEGILVGALEWIRETLSGTFEALKDIFRGLINFIAGVFTGDWDKAWKGLLDIGKGVINLLITAVEAFVNFFVKAINAVTGALNKISVTVPDWVPKFGGKTFGFNIPKIQEISLPRLATGAVIPPNREFLAVLGDQKSGTNIETPLSTMVEAFRAAMAESGGMNGTVTVVVNLDGKEVARNQVRHINDMTRAAGKPVLLY